MYNDDITFAFLQKEMLHGDCTLRVRLCGFLEYLLVNIDTAKFTEKNS